MNIEYLKGLNSLRFFAAFFVILSHGQLSLWKLGIVNEPRLAIFNRGGDGVEFFFTLSGFLITCLLLREISKTNQVSLRKFYLRRIFRIWPLYFLVVFIGFAILGIVYPKILHQNYLAFNIWKGLLLFIFFLPNIVTSFYPTGLLYPLWSIGVEEQYYIFWAPLLKTFRNNTLIAIIVFLLFSHLWYSIIYFDYFKLESHWLKFFLTQKFYAMAMGCFFAYMFMNKSSMFEHFTFSNKVFQLLILGIILYHYLFGFPFSSHLWFHYILAVLYSILIIHTIKPGSLINLEIQPFTFFGVISYGLYMYHMIIDYMLRFIMMEQGKQLISNAIFGPLIYHICLFGFTIIVAGLSYKYFESYFLKLKIKYS